MMENSETCGWLGAVVSCIAFGSFAVPIKSENSRKCDIDPLAFQTYKTSLCFFTAFIFTPLFHEEFYFTKWGLVSGLFWVPGGVAAIYAVKNAGLALSQGLWSSIIVIVSFSWGFFVFHEQVRSIFVASLALLGMVFGLLGMSYFSLAPSRVTIRPYSDVRIETHELGFKHEKKNDESKLQSVMSKRRRGLAAAVFNGVWGGSITVPMKFAPPEAKGPAFIFSFSIGACLITLLLWIFRFVHLFRQTKSIRRSYQALPSLHLSTMWKQGCLSGLLWSVGNIASLISVQSLGVGVGYSVVQLSILCSGLWGMFYFKEIASSERRLKWFISACVTVTGILVLSYQHVN